MSKSSSWRLDAVAAILLLAGLGLALCVFSTDPADSAGWRVYPSPGDSHLLGPPGYWLGQTLHDTLGVAVYVLLSAWFVLVLLLFLRRGWLTWSLRLVGWLMLLPWTALLAEHVGPAWLGGPLSGSGGSVGAWLTAQLAGHLHPAGQLVAVAGWGLVGMILAADFLFRGMLSGVCWTLALLPAPSPSARTVKERRKPPVFLDPAPERDEEPELQQEEDAVEEESHAAPPSNRIIPIRHHDEVAHLDPATQQSQAAALRLSDSARFADYELPALTLLDDAEPFPYEERDQFLRERAVLLEKVFADFDLNVRVVGINTGPVVTQYEIALDTGLRVNKITVLADDLALNLKVPSVRIVAPIPGKNTVGIEIPNEHRARVRLKEVLLTSVKKAAKAKIPLFLGKDTEGQPLVYDLAEMPHLLLAGRTGTGKSVCLNAIILSILMARRPDEVKMVMIDPKQLELSGYSKIPHLMHPIVTDMRKAEAILAWAVDKMEERYSLLSRARVRNIAGYNALSPDEIRKRVKPADDEEAERIPDHMPYIVIVIDEMGDLMMTMKKEVEGHIIRLAQKSRAAGIHLVVATQKPTVDVITGLIKSNLPARICFQVSSRTDSRVVLDEMGAEKLLGKGDMLFLEPGTSNLLRAQGTFLDEEEITRVVEKVEGDPCYEEELLKINTLTRGGDGDLRDRLRARDELYESAIEIILREGRGSVSLLQRALGIGYGRAARLIDFMAEDGIVGPYNGSNARDVMYTPEQWEEVKSGTKSPVSTAAV